MKELVQKLLLSLIKKDQLIGFVAGVLISLVAGVLGMSAQDVKDTICKAPVVQLPKN